MESGINTVRSPEPTKQTAARFGEITNPSGLPQAHDL